MDDGIRWAVLMQRIGGWCAIVGAALLAVAGLGFGEMTFAREPEVMLQQLSLQPTWYWPAVHAAFVAGACFWIVAFMGFNTSFRDVPARVLGHTGLVCLMLGVALGAVNSFVSGTALVSLAGRWEVASLIERSDIVRSTDTLLVILRGTWTGVVILFLGAPFVLMGAAVSRDARFPRALRWTGLLGGFGSLSTGALMLWGGGPATAPAALYLIFGALTALWMLGIGILVKRPYELERRRHEALQVA